MGQVREPRLACADFLRDGHCFRNAEMRRVLRAKKGIEDEHTHTTERLERLFGKLLGVGDIAEITNPISVYGYRTMRHSHWHHLDISNREAFACCDVVRTALGLARPRQRLDRGVEDVGEPFGQPLHRVWRTIHVDGHVTSIREGANIVNAVNVIRVIVGEEDGVDAAYISGNKLEAQLGGSVDEDAGAAIGFDQRTDSCSFVSGVSRSANITRASDLWDAKAGSCPQEGELQTVSTFRRLVVPGMSNGTPAVTMMRSPLEASSRCTTTVLVRSIISS